MNYIYIKESGQIERISDSKQYVNDVYEIVTDIDVSDINALSTYLESNEFLLSFLRAVRDKKLLDTIWISERHLSQPSDSKTLTDIQYAEWQTYWESLRDLPDTADLTDVTKDNMLTVFPTEPTL